MCGSEPLWCGGHPGGDVPSQGRGGCHPRGAAWLRVLGPLGGEVGAVPVEGGGGAVLGTGAGTGQVLAVMVAILLVTHRELASEQPP